jgi:hypothetical protein
MGFDDRLIQTLVIKRLAPAAVTAEETVGGADTTLSSDSAPGSLVIEVADASDVEDGDWLRVGDTGETEIRQVAAGGVTGLLVTLTAPLISAHDSGDQVREVDGAGTPELDDYGQPVRAETTVATVRGLIQPRSALEVAQADSAGVAIGTHIAYLRPLAGLDTDCWVEPVEIPFRFDVVSIADAGGVGHHLEVGLRRVG